MGEPSVKRNPVWWVLGLTLSATLPAVVTGLVSYKTAQMEADQKASAGYRALVSSHRKLETAFLLHVQDSASRLDEISGQFEFLRQVLSKLYDEHPQLRRPAALMFQPVFKMQRPSTGSKLPDTLDLAAEQEQ